MNCQFCLCEFDLIERLPAVSTEGSWFCIECAKYIVGKKVLGYIDQVQNPIQVDPEKLNLIPRFCKTHYQFHSICLTHIKFICVQCEPHENCEFFQGDFSSFENQVNTFLYELMHTCSSVQLAGNIFLNNEEIIQASIKQYEELLNLLINAKSSENLKLKSETLSKMNFSLIKDLNLSKSHQNLYNSIIQDLNPDQEIIETCTKLSNQDQNPLFIFKNKQISSWSPEPRTYLIQQDLQDTLQIKSLGISMSDKADFTLIESLVLKCGHYSCVDEFKLIENPSRSIAQDYLLKKPLMLKRNQTCSITLKIDSPSLYTFHNPTSSQISITDHKNPKEPSLILYLIPV